MHIGLHIKYSLFLSYFNEDNFLDKFSKNTQMLNLIKILLVGAEVFYADRQTYEKATNHFSSFAKSSKNVGPSLVSILTAYW